jgi:hypothetical protein
MRKVYLRVCEFCVRNEPIVSDYSIQYESIIGSGLRQGLPFYIWIMSHEWGKRFAWVNMSIVSEMRQEVYQSIFEYCIRNEARVFPVCICEYSSVSRMRQEVYLSIPEYCVSTEARGLPEHMWVLCNEWGKKITWVNVSIMTGMRQQVYSSMLVRNVTRGVYVSIVTGRRQEVLPGYMWVLHQEWGKKFIGARACEYCARNVASGLPEYMWVLCQKCGKWFTWVYVSIVSGMRQVDWLGTHDYWWKDRTGGPDRKYQLKTNIRQLFIFCLSKAAFA